MLLLYNLFIRLYFFGIRLWSIRNPKAKRWLAGRKKLFAELESKLQKDERYIWMHCSSAGEFEQGKPLAEALKKHYPGYKLLISFFSPSGYSVATNYASADVVCYLPLDTRRNAERFLSVVRPSLAIFVKYEFWYHHLSVAASRQIPLLLISATFRQNQIFFQPQGKFFRNMLRLFRHIFVQEESSLALLQAAGVTQCSVSGDTRFDRVAQIRAQALPVPFVDAFLEGKKTLIAGSTWEDDEDALMKLAAANSQLKLVIAPHEVTEAQIQRLQKSFSTSLLYSSLKTNGAQTAQVLLIDGVGLLSRLYQHATLTYIGGGFTRDGVHNVLEAAVWHKPVFFGPNYSKYKEAADLIECGGGFSFATANDLNNLVQTFVNEEETQHEAGKKAGGYVAAHTGATGKILWLIQEKRLLTN